MTKLIRLIRCRTSTQFDIYRFKGTIFVNFGRWVLQLGPVVTIG